MQFFSCGPREQESSLSCPRKTSPEDEPPGPHEPRVPGGLTPGGQLSCKISPAYAVPPEKLLECLAFQAASLCGPGHIAPVLLEEPREVAFVEVAHHPQLGLPVREVVHRGPSGCPTALLDEEILRGYGPGAGQYHGLLYFVFQLPHVSRPVVGEERLHGLRGHPDALLPQPRAVLF